MEIEVLIAGAGPTGLTLAIELGRRGIGVRVADRATAFAQSSRADALRPRTLEVFEDLGVLDEVLAAGHRPYPKRVYHDGEFRAERQTWRHEAARPDLPYPNMVLLGQARTEQILRDRLAGFGVRVELGSGVTGFSQDKDGVTAELGGETVRARYLVGADGGKSFVRKRLGVAFPGTTDESVRMMICDVVADGLDREHSYWFARTGPPSAGAALVPVTGRRHYQLRVPLGEQEPDTSLAGVQALLDGLSGGYRVRVRDVAWSTVLRLNLRTAARFRVGRVFLAGDAAHVWPPTGSEGLNVGVEDAANLAWKLAAGPALLDTYDAERRMIANRITTMITGLMRTYAGHREEPAPDLSYRDSPLSADERTVPGSLRAGDRAPDAPVYGLEGQRTRLFELFRGPHATLLRFGGDAPDSLPWNGELHVHDIAGRGGEGEYVDRDGHAFAAYDVTPGTQVLVRPDGYVLHIR